jgi:host factor-I protein
MATTDFNTSLPSIRQVQNWIKQKPMVEFKLITGDLITGQVFWQDHNCVCIVDSNNEQIIVWKVAIVYMKSRSEAVLERALVPQEVNLDIASIE